MTIAAAFQLLGEKLRPSASAVPKLGIALKPSHLISWPLSAPPPLLVSSAPPLASKGEAEGQRLALLTSSGGLPAGELCTLQPLGPGRPGVDTTLADAATGWVAARVLRV